MKIVATSDLHGYFPEIQPCDLLLIAGDVCPVRHKNRLVADHNKTAQVDWICSEFAEWCAEQPAKNIVWIAGNHDFGPEVHGFKRSVEKTFPEHVHYLKDDVIEIEGRHIYGMPWTPNLPTWAFYASEKAWRWLPDDIPTYTDILMMHSPPSGLMLDGGHPDWAAPYVLAQITQRIQPELCVFGHIHEGYGEIKVKGITFANVAHCDEFYDPIQQPKEWEL